MNFIHLNKIHLIWILFLLLFRMYGNVVSNNTSNLLDNTYIVNDFKDCVSFVIYFRSTIIKNQVSPFTISSLTLNGYQKTFFTVQLKGVSSIPFFYSLSIV